MDTLDCILTRRSVRRYKPIPLPWDLVGKVLEAGRFAPCAGNIQNWKFIAVLDEGKRKTLATASLQQAWMASAPVHIVVLGEPDKAKRMFGMRGENFYSIQNCSAAVQNMLLAAHNQGLGACWVGGFDEDKVNSIVAANEWQRAQAIITLGYPDEKPLCPPKYKFDNVAFLNKWMGRMKDVDAVLGYTSANVLRTIDKGKALFQKLNDKIKKE